MPGSASSWSDVAELMSRSSALGAGAIFSAGAILPPGAILPAGAILESVAGDWAIDGEAASRPRVSAVAASEASVKRRMALSSRDGLIGDKASFEFVAAPWPRNEWRIKGRDYLPPSFGGAPLPATPESRTGCWIYGSPQNGASRNDDVGYLPACSALSISTRSTL